ncbi:hypothetical protein HYU11_03260 [Candidatus Woesearchaeota archaeon]|nr:hypothetical protein [Candidatus Woesearchaeota archaeon]
MGLFGFFSQQSEEKLHAQIALILSEYHKLKALLEREKALADQISHVHKRIDAINAGIRDMNTRPSGPDKIHYLQQLVQSEKGLLEMQKRFSRELEERAGEANRRQRRVEHASREIKKAA